MDAIEAAAQSGQGVNDLRAKLLARRADLAHRLTKLQKVFDVVNDRILEATHGSSVSVSPSPSRAATGQAGTLKYLPRGSMEPPEDYSKRILMTPWFSETKDILNDREGSIFSDPPLVQHKAETQNRAAPVAPAGNENSDKLEAGVLGTGTAEKVSSASLEGSAAEVNPLQDFIERATPEGKSFAVFSAEILRSLQVSGYGAVFIDKRTASASVPVLSKADATKQKIGEPVCVFYEAQQILDYDFDENGELLWIKLIESNMERTAWDSNIENVKTVFVIDKVQIQSWKIYDRRPVPEQQAAVSHGYGFVPVAFGNFFPDKNGLGNSCLVQCADADIAATQILSDLRWTLFVLGSPILQFRAQSNDEGKTARALGVGTSRYTVVNCAKGEMGEEDLSFVQMDGTGIDNLWACYNEMKNKAKDASGKGGDVALTAPAEQSGVSRAWEFKTGEERMLFLLTFQLQEFCTKIVRLAALIKKLKPEDFCVEFSKDFEVADPTKKATALTPVLDRCKQEKLSTPYRAGLRELVEISIDMTPEEKSAFEDELAAIDLAADAQAEADLKAEQMKAVVAGAAKLAAPFS